MKTRILVLIVAAALLVSFGSKFSGQSKNVERVAAANATVGGIAEDSK
jgi:hypothetical protein